jgi:hypothetical protein
MPTTNATAPMRNHMPGTLADPGTAVKDREVIAGDAHRDLDFP